MKINSMYNTDNIGKIICFIFVLTLGFGEVVSFGTIKLSYLTASAFFFYSIFIEKKLNIFKKGLNFNLFIFLLLWIAYSIVQLMWVKNIDLWFSFFRTLLLNILSIILLLNYIGSKDDLVLVMRSFLFLILICLIVGLWEYKTSQHINYMNYSEMNEITIYNISNKPLSFFGNINDNASVLFLGLIISLIYFGIERKKNILINIIRLSFLALIIFEIIIIDARAIKYSVPFLFIFILFFYVLNKMSSSEKTTKMLLIAFFISFTIMIIIALSINPIEYYFGLISNGTDYMSDIGRINIIRNGYEAFLDSFGFGLGAGQSITISNINLHSIYLEILFEYGILVAGYLLFLFIKMMFSSPNVHCGLSDCTIRSFPIILLLAGVSSSKLFSLKPFWIVLSIVLIVKFGNIKLESFNSRQPSFDF